MPTTFIIGQILMLVASKKILREEHKFLTKPFLLSMAYALLIFAPITGYYFYAHMGWSTVYLRSEALIPWYAGPLIVFLYVVGMFFGSALAQALIQNGQKKIVFVTLALSLIWFLVVAFLTRDEYSHIGTFAQFHAGLARSIFSDSDFMKELNLMGLALAAPAAALAFYLRGRQHE